MDSMHSSARCVVNEKKPVVQLERMSQEVVNISEDSGHSSISEASVHSESSMSAVKTENEGKIVDDVKFVDPEFNTKNLCPEIMQKKKFWHKELLMQRELERKNHEKVIQEKQYKRLMHLLTQSKAFTNFMSSKFEVGLNAEKSKANVKSNNASNAQNLPLKEKENLDGNAASINKKTEKKNKRKLSDDELCDELLAMSDEEISNKENIQSVNNFVNPKFFSGELRPYQVEGLNWLKTLYENGLNGILADEMGLGKTIQIIALMAYLIEKHISGPFLIIVPLSILGNWLSEFQTFAPQLPVVMFYGNEDTRNKIKKKIASKTRINSTCSSYPIVVTTYETAMNNLYFLKLFHWKYIVIDEAQRIKNTKSRLFKTVKQFDSVNRLLLTGTPLQNNLSELWSLLNFLLPDIFNDLDVFQSWFNAKQLQDEDEKKKLLKQEEEKRVLFTLREILQPFILRRLKEDVCKDIPMNKEIIIYTPLTELQYNLYSAVLSKSLNRAYSAYLQSVIVDVDGVRPKRRCANKVDYKHCFDEDKKNASPDNTYHYVASPKKIGNVSADSPDVLEWSKFTKVTEKNINYLLKIRHTNYVSVYKQIVNHPYMLYNPLRDANQKANMEDILRDCGKLLVLDLVLKKLKSKHKILIFSTMSMVLDILEDYLIWKNYRYVRLDGSVNYEKRKVNIKMFNEDPEVFIFLLTTKAGGVGLNLTAADTVIIYDSDWNPQNDLQAMARCHRIGQTKRVAVYRLCNKGTIDDIVLNRANAKRFLEKAIISKKNDNVLDNKEDLLKLKNFFENEAFKVLDFKKTVYTDAELDQILDRSNW